jgi:hypothetical protein
MNTIGGSSARTREVNVVLTQDNGEGKLEEADILHEGKDDAQDTTNVDERVQTGSGAAGPIESQVHGPHLPAISALPRARSTGGISGAANMESRPFLGVGISCHKKKRCGAYSARMTCCERLVIF